MHWQWIVVVFLLLILMPGQTAGAGSIQEGKWLMTMMTKIDGNSSAVAEAQKAMQALEDVPNEAKDMMKSMHSSMDMQMGIDGQGTGIRTTMTQCITNQDPVPDIQRESRCQQKHNISGDVVTFQVVCRERGSETTLDGRMTYTGDTMKGQTKSHQVSRGQTMDATIDITGHYLGPCTN